MDKYLSQSASNLNAAAYADTQQTTIGGQALRAGLAPPPPSRLVDQAVQRVEEIALLLDQTQNALGANLDRNLGGIPAQADNSKTLPPSRGGNMGHLLDRLDILHGRASDALDMAQRLDNRI